MLQNKNKTNACFFYYSLFFFVLFLIVRHVHGQTQAAQRARLAYDCSFHSPGKYLTAQGKCLGTTCPDGYYTRDNPDVPCENPTCAKCYPCTAGTLSTGGEPTKGFVDPDSGYWTCGRSNLGNNDQFWYGKEHPVVRLNYEKFARKREGPSWYLGSLLPEYYGQPEQSGNALVYRHTSPCPPGTFGTEALSAWDDRNVMCKPCGPGMYQPKWGQTKCLGTPCPPGKCGLLGSMKQEDTTCDVCRPGQYWDGQAGRDALCPKGFFGKHGASSLAEAYCIPCLSGTYSSQEGSSECIGTPCPPGTWGIKGRTDNNASGLFCQPCRKGSYQMFPGEDRCMIVQECTDDSLGIIGAERKEQAFCSPCPGGMIFNGTSCEGTPCPAGTYFGLLGYERGCVPCPPGQFSNQTGLFECLGTACKKGYSGPLGSTSSENATCTKCPKGTYNDGFSICVTCKDGSFSDVEGTENDAPFQAKTIDELGDVFPADFNTLNTTCRWCPPGTYSSSNSMSCIACPANTVYAERTERIERLGFRFPKFSYFPTGGKDMSYCTSCYALGGYAPIVRSSFAEFGPAYKLPFPFPTYPFPVYDTSSGALIPARWPNYDDIIDAIKTSPEVGFACAPCPPNTFADPHTNCSLCPVNTHTIKTLDLSLVSDVALTRAVQSPNPIPIGGTSQYECINCPSGYLSLSGSDCIKCPPGAVLFLGDNQASPDPPPICACPSGSYRSTNIDGTIICTKCPVGSASSAVGAASSSACKVCPLGTFSAAEGSAVCTPCATGSYANSTGSLSCFKCTPGTYSETLGAIHAETCVACPAGSFSGVGAGNCTACVTGSHQPSPMSIRCLLCPASTYSDVLGAVSCTSCPPGTAASVLGAREASVCNPCEMGTYQPSPMSISCLSCPASTFSDVLGAVSCTSCPPGTDSSVIRAKSSDVCSQCSVGSYSSSSTTGCVKCAAGTASNVMGATSSATCIDCPIGSYSDAAGQGTCTQCPYNTYTTSTGALFCTDCAADKYTLSIGSSAESQCVACAAGTLLVKQQHGPSFCEPCAAGSYEATPGVCTRCPMGTYSTSLGATSASTCQQCPQGTYSPTLGANSSSSCLSCPAGSYSSSLGATECSNCWGGSYSTSLGATSASTCQACPQGTYSPTLGANSSSSCLSCPAGTYNSQTGLASVNDCTKCNEGTYSSTTGAIASSTCINCPLGTYRGFFDDATSLASCLPCPLGEYAPYTGANRCSFSPSGTFVNTTGASTTEKCPLGTAFNGNKATSISDCVPCAAGKFAPAVGMSTCTACPAGTFSSQVGSFVCDKCPLGTFSALTGQTSSASCILCPAGSYANSTASAACLLCPARSNSSSIGAVSISTCMLSPVGYYARIAGTGTASPCWAGSFSSLEGALTCISCPVGSFSTVVGATSGSSCTSCPPGTYSFGSSICSTCPNGTTLISPSRGCVPTPIPGDLKPTPSLYISGMQEEGFGAFSEVYQPEGVSFVAGPFGNAGSAISLSAGSYLSINPSPGSELATALPSGNATDVTLSLFVNCPPSTPTSTLLQFGSLSSNLHISVTKPVVGPPVFSYFAGNTTVHYVSVHADGAATEATMDEPTCMLMNPDGSHIYVLHSKAIRIVNSATGYTSTLIYDIRLTVVAQSRACALHLSADGTKLYVLSPDGLFYVIDIQTSSMTLVPVQTQLKFFRFAFTHDDGMVFFIQSTRKAIHVLDMSTLNLSLFRVLETGQFFFNAILLAPDGKSLTVSASTQQSIQFNVDIATNATTRTLFSTAGNLDIMTSTVDGQIYFISQTEMYAFQVYDPSTGATKSLSTFIFPTRPLAVAVNRDGSRIFAGRKQDVLFAQTWRSNGIITVATIVTPLQFCDNKWRHLALAYNSNAGTTSLSVDGVVKLTSAMTANQGGTRRRRQLGALVLPDAGESKITIGSNGDFQTLAAFTGAVSDLRVYKSILTPTDLSDLTQPKLIVIANAVNPVYHVNSTLYSWTCLAGFYGPEVFYSKINGFWIYTSNPLAPTWWPIPEGPKCLPCPAGFFASLPNSTVCTACEAGKYSSDTNGAISCDNVCLAGTFSSPGSGECVPCDVGTYNGNTGASSCNGCADGMTTLSKGATSVTSCVPCNPGTFSTVLTNHECFSCSPGTFSTSFGTSSCSPCTAGTFSNSTNPTTCTSCPMGTYSANGAKMCLGCPQGTFSTSVGATSSFVCIPCAVGTFASAVGSTSCTISPSGFYVTTIGSFAPMSCPAGSTSVAGSTFCTVCPVGSYAEQSGSDCIPAPPGYYTSGSVGATSIFACPAGSTSVAGSTSCTLCQPGSFAPLTGSPQCNLTAPGTYTIAAGAKSALDCPAGSTSVAGSTFCTVCPVGSYAEQSGSDCIPAPPGYYTSGSVGATSVFACPAGSTSVAGSTSCTLCQPGSFAPLTGSRECSPAPAGFFVTATGASSVSEVCPAGSTSVAGSSSCTLCQPGTYSEHDASPECMLAPIGSFTNTSGATSVFECPPGTSSNAAGATSCTPCAPGSYSLGNSGCFPCSAGSFQAISGQGSCDVCPANTYTTTKGNTNCKACPAYASFASLTSIGLSTCTCAPNAAWDTSLEVCTSKPLGQTVLIPFAFSAKHLCSANNASAVLVGMILSPPSGITGSLRASLASSLGYDPSAAFLESLTVCNQSFVGVNSSHPVNTETLANIHPPVFTSNVSGSSTSGIRRRQLGEEAYKYDPFIAPRNDQVIFNMGLYVQADIADSLTAFLRSVGENSGSVSDLMSARALEVFVQIYGVGEAKISGNETTGGATPLTTSAYLLKIAALAVAGSSTPIFNSFVTDSRPALAPLLSAVNLPLDANVSFITLWRGVRTGLFTNLGFGPITILTADSTVSSSSSSSSSLSAGAIVGIVIGLLFAIIIFFFARKKRHNKEPAFDAVVKENTKNLDGIVSNNAPSKEAVLPTTHNPMVKKLSIKKGPLITVQANSGSSFAPTNAVPSSHV